MLKWWRENRWAAGIVAVIRLVLGWQWMTAGYHKLIAAKPFDAAGYLNNAVTNPVVDKATGEAVYPTFIALLYCSCYPQAGR